MISLINTVITVIFFLFILVVFIGSMGAILDILADRVLRKEDHGKSRKEGSTED